MHDGVMRAGGVVLNGNLPVVDKVRDIIGGTATVFMGDLRVTTNVQKPDGSRAVGTKLAKGPVHDAVLGAGQPFRGEADILGTAYYTAYDPIRGADGAVIGVLYVGVKKSAFMTIMAHLAWSSAGVGGALTIVGGGLLALVMHRMMAKAAGFADGDAGSGRGAV